MIVLESVLLLAESFSKSFSVIKQTYRHLFGFVCVSGCECGDYVQKNVMFVAANWLLRLILNGVK